MCETAGTAGGRGLETGRIYKSRFSRDGLLEAVYRV